MVEQNLTIYTVNWRFNSVELSPEFFNIIEHLESMSYRWQGRSNNTGVSPKKQDMAANYALELQDLHKKALQDPMFCTQGFMQPVSVLFSPSSATSARHAGGGPSTSKANLLYCILGTPVENTSLTPFRNRDKCVCAVH